MSEHFEDVRSAYGAALIELGRVNKNLVVLDADLSPSTKTCKFAEEFPERFFDVGVAEANLISMAAGFASEKGLNQFKQSAAYPELNVKLVVTHGGISVGGDGVSHFCIEDIAVMRSLPNVTVVVPADAIETRVATKAIAEHEGPVFMRLSRPKTPCVYEEGYRYSGTKLTFQLGKSVTLKEGKDVTIVATGLMVAEALVAASNLAKEGIDAGVINVHTIKPLDQEAILRAARESGAIVTAEEHNILGGLGGAVAEVLVENTPVPMARVGIRDSFCESGSWKELFAKYGLTSSDIVKKVKEVMKRRG